MEKLTDAQILAADAILEMCNINGTATPFHILGKSNSNRWGLEIDKICEAADFLLDAEVIKLTSDNNRDGYEYMFTTIGEKQYQKGKRTIDYLNELIEHEAKQHAKEERDEKNQRRSTRKTNGRIDSPKRYAKRTTDVLEVWNGTRRTTKMAISLDTTIGSSRIYFRHH